MDCSTPAFPVHHHAPGAYANSRNIKSVAIQPSHPLSPPFPPAFNLSQHQSFPMTQFFTSDGQTIGVSASASVFPINILNWFPLGLTGLISLLPKGLSRVFSSTTVQKQQFFSCQPSLWSNSHIHTWLLEKPEFWWYRPLSEKWSLSFNVLSNFVTVFPPRSKYLLISCLQSLSTVILEPKKRKAVTVSIFPLLFAMKGLDAMSLMTQE